MLDASEVYEHRVLIGPGSSGIQGVSWSGHLLLDFPDGPIVTHYPNYTETVYLRQVRCPRGWLGHYVALLEMTNNWLPAGSTWPV